MLRHLSRTRGMRNNLAKKRRDLRASTDPFDIANERFIEIFRFPKDLCKEIIDIFTVYTQDGMISSRLSKELRVLVALRFFAQGSYQRSVGQDFFLNVSQSSVSRCVKEIVNICNSHLVTEYVKFPSTPLEIQQVKVQFFEKFEFPGIIGAIDGTHVKIRAPSKDEEHVYVCRKGGHSINVQVVCDANLKIIDCNARFGGTAHDSSVWRASGLRVCLARKYDRGDRNWWLIGDSGYPQLPYLMTPIEQGRGELSLAE